MNLPNTCVRNAFICHLHFTLLTLIFLRRVRIEVDNRRPIMFVCVVMQGLNNKSFAEFHVFKLIRTRLALVLDALKEYKSNTNRLMSVRPSARPLVSCSKLLDISFKFGTVDLRLKFCCAVLILVSCGSFFGPLYSRTRMDFYVFPESFHIFCRNLICRTCMYDCYRV